MKDIKTHPEEHHCNVIEKDLLAKEYAECDRTSTNEEEKKQCYIDVEKKSEKRLRACLVT